MISRRDFLQVGMAASAIVGASGFGNWARLAAQQQLTQEQLLEFDTSSTAAPQHLRPVANQRPNLRQQTDAGTAGHLETEYRRGVDAVLHG